MHIYANAYTTIKTEIVFMTMSFIFHKRKKSFHDIVIYFVH